MRALVPGAGQRWTCDSGPALTGNWEVRGGLQHQISRVLKACDIVPDDERTGRAAGVACAASGTTDVVDAIVVVTAVCYQSPIVTSDRGDLSRIAGAIGVKVRFFTT